MSLVMVKEDIAEMAVDAIVNPTDAVYSGSGGLDRHIQKHAGPDLWMDLKQREPILPGEVVCTPGYELPAKYIIHTQGPVWHGGGEGEADILASCYRNSLETAVRNGCETIAVPLISGGRFGFPNDEAMKIARGTITDFLQDHNITVYLVLHRMHTFNMGAKLFEDLARYVEENYVELDTDIREPEEEKPDLHKMLASQGETFSCMLDRLREEKDMKPSKLYNRARIHKAVYSKIMNNMHYQVSKKTAVAFGLALDLPWDQFNELLGSAGFAMTTHNKFDIVIEYFVKNGEYDIDKINEALYNLDPDLPLIGF